MKYIMPLFLFLVAGCGPEIVTTESGLRYSDNKAGEGRSAEMGDLVTLHLNIWTIQDSSDLFENWTDDTTKVSNLIGSSRQHNQPAKFVLGSGEFIKGSEEGIVGMKPGGIRIIIIPSNLAYGEEGAGPVPPNTDLKLEIELVEAKPMPVVERWDFDSTQIQTTTSGLKYVILEEGSGDKADSNDIVTVHYTGYLQNGNKFDSSVERDEPITFSLGIGQVIPGWEEGISLLSPGAKAKFFIPPHLAYGERDMGLIPPNSTLVFDVELIDVKKN